jgi:hypothetical protein
MEKSMQRHELLMEARDVLVIVSGLALLRYRIEDGDFGKMD